MALLNLPRPGRAIALIAAVQFVYILDFMMVLPLGPDLTKALGFAANRLGWLSVAYTLASVLSGLVCVRLLDRWQRKPALLAALAMFGLATLATVLCRDLPSLLLARAMTGLFGGPMVALGMAVVTDITPPEQRGKAIGQVMVGFSLAAIAGVPLALELASRGGWTMPFLAVAVCCALLWSVAARWLPSMGDHLGQQAAGTVSLSALLKQPKVLGACALQAASQFSAFLVIPSFSAYYVLNLGVARDHLGALYLAGGVAALLTLQVLGRVSDRFGPLPAIAVASLGLVAGLVPFLSGGASPVWLPFVLFMAGNAGRNVALAAATSQVPGPGERAGFMALQSMVQDLAIAVAALVSSLILSESAHGQLTGMAPVACLALGGVWVVLWMSASLLPGRGEPAPLHTAPGSGQAQAHRGIDGGDEQVALEVVRAPLRVPTQAE